MRRRIKIRIKIRIRIRKRIRSRRRISAPKTHGGAAMAADAGCAQNGRSR